MFSTEQVDCWRLRAGPVVGVGSVLALLLLRSEALCGRDLGVLAPPPPLLCCSTFTMWAVPAVVLCRGMATAVAAPGGRSGTTWRRGVEHSSLCVLRRLPSSSRLLLDAMRPLTPTWLPKSSELLWLLCELSVLRFSELES